jgi:CheY-like chemotaxis protein
VVLNLAINARDAMSNGGRLLIKTAMVAGSVRMTVTDAGCGIPQAIQSKVFDPFFTTKGALGTGIGLSTVYGIIEQNGGTIAVASTEGQGTTFTIDAGGPIEALAAIKAQSDIDLVITDVVMPDMNGFDLAMELKRIAPGVRVVFMSGFTSDHFKRSIDDLFLEKPFTVESLTKAVDQALSAAIA